MKDFTRPELKTRSIYANQDYSKVEDFVACWSVEVDTCEKLLRRGYVFAGTVRIADRVKELESEIGRLLDERRRKRDNAPLAWGMGF